MAFSHGSKAKLEIDTGGTPMDLSDFISGVSYERSADTPDVTALGDEAHKYIPGLFEGSMSSDGHYDPTAYAKLDGLLNSITDFSYWPQGEIKDLPVFTGEVIVSSLSLDTPVDDKASWSFELKVNGKPTLDKVP